MDLRISGTEVFMQLHKGYVVEDDSALLNDVAKFKPLVDWLTKFRPTEFSLSLITIRAVQKLAQRIATVVFEVTLVSSYGKEPVVQTVTLTDEPGQVVLLPIAAVEGKKYALLAATQRVPLGGSTVDEAFTGTFQKDGTFDCVAADQLLEKIGFNLNEKYCQGLSDEEVALGEEGFAAVRPMFVEQSLSQSEFDALFGPQASAPVKAEDGSVLKAVPLAELIGSTSDLKAMLAASLFLAKTN